MTNDKNQALINYILNCPVIRDNPLFFNFANEDDNTNQILTVTDDVAINKPYVDGSVEKRYTVNVLMYKSVAYNPIVLEAQTDENGNTTLVPSPVYVDENLVDMSDGQSLIDWIIEQNDNKIFPDFGEYCIVESIEPLTNKPTLNGVSVENEPPLAQYSIGIRVSYLDTSKQLWK